MAQTNSGSGARARPREQFWLGHIRACRKQALSLSDYAKAHHAPEHRAGVDFTPAAHRPAFTRQTLDLRLRQQAGQRLANTNTLDSGHGRSPDRLQCRNSNLIRGRGPLQPLVSWSVTSLSEHQCGTTVAR